MSYNQFIHGLKTAGVELDRKILADLAVNDAAAFASLAEQAKGRSAGPRRQLSAISFQPSGGQVTAMRSREVTVVVVADHPRTRLGSGNTAGDERTR